MATYVPIQSVTLAASTATVSFTALPQDYTDLVIVCNAASESTNAFPYIQFNGDTGTSYSMTQMYGNGSSAISARVPDTAQMFNSDISLRQSTITGNFTYNIMNYSNSTTFKTSLLRQNSMDAADYVGSLAAVGTWRNTVPVTSIDIKLTRGGTAYNFSAGSTFDLYGISHNNAKVTSASGGTDIFYDSSYVYHVFKGSGVFTPNRSLTADYLVVGGGGGSYTSSGGGGGAGGYRTSIGGSTLSLTAGTSYTVIIGAGGASGATSGTSSVFSTITSAGGGKGGTWVTAGAAGGSGGGGSYYQNGYTSGSVGGAGNTPSTSPSQGNSGGTGSGDNTGGSSYSGAGGGGATANGANATNSGAGAGGAGAYSTLTDALGAVSGLGELSSTHYYFAGGGGGGSDPSRTPNANGAGGVGGGGAGGTASVNAVSGKTNTGGGAGGGTTNAASGGSGIVVVRYAR